MEITHEPLHFENEVRYSKISWANLQVLFEFLFYLAKVLNMAIVKNNEVKLYQTLNQSVWNYVILYKEISF
jgi:hypothetical protein